MLIKGLNWFSLTVSSTLWFIFRQIYIIVQCHVLPSVRIKNYIQYLSLTWEPHRRSAESRRRTSSWPHPPPVQHCCSPTHWRHCEQCFGSGLVFTPPPPPRRKENTLVALWTMFWIRIGFQTPPPPAAKKTHWRHCEQCFGSGTAFNPPPPISGPIMHC